MKSIYRCTRVGEWGYSTSTYPKCTLEKPSKVWRQKQLNGFKVDTLNNKKRDGLKCKGRFTRAYLNNNRLRGTDKGLTPSSFVNLFYYGGNKFQTDKIKADLAVNADKVFKCLSCTGADAYFPISMHNKDLENDYKLVKTMKVLSPRFSYSAFKKGK